MASTGLCGLVLRAGFAAFFIAHGYGVLAHPEGHKALFRAQYARFDAQVKALTGHALPGMLSSGYAAKHADEALLGFGWAVMAAAVASLLYDGFGVLAALLYLAETLIAQDALSLFGRAAAPRAWQPVAEAGALLVGALAVNCWRGHCGRGRKAR